MTTTTIANKQVETFKKILEYFLKHIVSRCEQFEEKLTTTSKIYFTDDEKTKILKLTGQGYNRNGIQEQMEGIAGVSSENKFTLGDSSIIEQKICISVYPTESGFKKGSYLHLVSSKAKKSEPAGTNINPKFGGEGDTVFYGLEVGPSQNSPTYVFPPLTYTFDELGLGSSQCRENQVYNLQTFYDYFMEMRKAELMGALTYKGKKQLLATYNMIMTGAPGTGKTWSAMNIASWIICGKSYETVMDENGTPDDRKDFYNRCELVQFHPSYDYTDFVEGLRPISNNGNPSSGSNIGFELKKGVFRKFCEKALKTADKKYVFIIDEINRGELSKIFGELFFSIDPGYRGPKGAVLTQYANMSTENIFDEKLGSDKEFGHFFVPKNVYIVGTMNDIDRSVESMDFAMRRRFSFIEVKANEREDMWGEDDWKDIAKMCMEAVNKEIEIIPGLSSAYHIGPAYFKKLNAYAIKEGKDTVGYDFFKLWDNHLYGVIFEYLRGKKNAEKTINEIQDVYLKALCRAINTRFNQGEKWGKILISKAKIAYSIDNNINDEKTAKAYLVNLKELTYNNYATPNERSRVAILNLSNDVNQKMAIGKKIERLIKNGSDSENEEGQKD